MLRYVECPRDAWQGLSKVIPTEQKAAHLQHLLDAGFSHLDMGSFVSPKAVPQLADTEEVLVKLKPPRGSSLLGIVANERGLERALAAPNLTAVGYPLSVNDTFQQRNTQHTLAASWPLVQDMVQATHEGGLELVIYLSMGFGNPYGDPWSPADTARAVERVRELGVSRVALADTVGTATPELLAKLLADIPEAQRLGLHLHARPDTWQRQLERALDMGLNWFEGALGGVGGCPFAADNLIGNLPTESVLPWLEAKTGTQLVSKAALRTLADEAAQLAAAYQ